jgi:EmrB/QacA subfamily drug resistance transporter
VTALQGRGPSGPAPIAASSDGAGGPPAAVTPYAARLSKRRIRYTVAGALAGMFLAAVDATVVATAMPTVVSELGGVESYAWVFSIYLLTEVATIPLWGRLADVLGRKPVFLAGMAVFLAGSALSGLSTSMTMLVVCRGIQGIGAGALLPIAQTIFGDLFTIEQRVRMAALFGAVFGLASVAGPLLGGFITDHLDWRWVFYVNLPVGIVSMVVVAVAMIEPLQERRSHAIDYIGALLLLLGSGALLFALESGGREYAWTSPLIVVTVGAGAALGAAFVWWERRCPEPLLPLDLFGLPVLRPVLLVTFALTVPMFAVISFLPLFVQVVLGASATSAGQVLTPLMLGSIVGSFLGSRGVLRFGYRPVMAAGMALSITGLVLLTRLGVESSRLDVTIAMVFLGLGMGPLFVTGTLVAQSSVTMEQRGVASSLVNFVRQLGGAVGVAAAGAVMISTLTARLAEVFPGAGVSASDVLRPRTDDAPPLPADTWRAVQEAFAGALHRTFWFALGAGLLAALLTVLVPKGRPGELHPAEAGAGPGEPT